MFQKFDSTPVLSLWRVSAWGRDRPAQEGQEMEAHIYNQRKQAVNVNGF